MSGQKTEARVLEFIRKYHMADGGDGVLAAVSGGADSVCLLLVLAELKKELGIRLCAFHLNHGLRGPEADRDEMFTKDLCSELGIPCVAAHEDVAAFAGKNSMSEEEAGRYLRYRHLEEQAKRLSCSRIAVAHHKDDGVETVLMNLFRGSGLTGLGGIRPVRGTIIRPLLCLRRQEIEDYLKERGRTWCEDSTNRTGDYQRNRIRNDLVPWVKEHVNSQAEEHILRVSALAAQADEYFAGQAEILLSEGRRNGMPENGIWTEIFDRQPDIIKTYLVRALIGQAAGGQRDISSRHLEAVLALGGPGKGTEADLPYGIKANRGYDLLTVSVCGRKPSGGRMLSAGPGAGEHAGKRAGEADGQEGFKGCKLHGTGAGEYDSTAAYMVPPECLKNGVQSSILFQSGGWELTFRRFPVEKDLEFPKNQYTKWFDYDKIRDALFVRTRKDGDYFQISGGKTKILRRYLIDQKIPEEKRSRIPLLTEGNHILWVIGYRISEYYKISDTTENILEVKFCKGEDHG